MSLSPLEKYDLMREQCRIRAQRFYEKHKVEIGIKRNEGIQKKKEIKKKKSCVVFNFKTIKNKLENTEKIKSEFTRKSHINRMKTFFEMTSCKNIEVCLINYSTIIDIIKNATYGKNNTPYKINSKKSIMESFLYCLDNLDISLDEKIREKYQDYYGTLKISSNDEIVEKKNTESVISWDEYEKRVKDKFGIDSKQYLMIMLHSICNARDDFDLYIVNDAEMVKEDTTKNYLIRDGGKYTLCMQSYKTSNGKKPIFIIVSEQLNKLITSYIKKHKIQDRLFPTVRGLNTPFVASMHKKIDVAGSIGMIRHIIVSTQMDKELTNEEKVALSKNSFHSINTQIDYRRNIERK